MSETEREKLVIEGETTQGMVVGSESSATDRRMTQVRVSVRFKDGQTAEFSEELANLYQPAPGSPEAQRLAEVVGRLAEEYHAAAERLSRRAHA